MEGIGYSEIDLLDYSTLFVADINHCNANCIFLEMEKKEGEEKCAGLNGK